MGDIQSQETSCPSSVSQTPLIAALDGPQDCVAEMRTRVRGAAGPRDRQLLRRDSRREAVPCRTGRSTPSSTCRPTSASRSAATVTDSLAFCTTLPGTGPRQPRAGRGVRRGGVRADVVRDQPRRDRGGTGAVRGVAGRLSDRGRYRGRVAVTEDEVRDLLTMDDAIAAVEAGLRKLRRRGRERPAAALPHRPRDAAHHARGGQDARGSRLQGVRDQQGRGAFPRRLFDGRTAGR